LQVEFGTYALRDLGFDVETRSKDIPGVVVGKTGHEHVRAKGCAGAGACVGCVYAGVVVGVVGEGGEGCMLGGHMRALALGGVLCGWLHGECLAGGWRVQATELGQDKAASLCTRYILRKRARERATGYCST
jgi:hypothetical protein